jgi:hypothetical protein
MSVSIVSDSDACNVALGVNNAITFTGDTPGTTVTLAIPLIGFSQTYSGATRSDVQNQIHDFIKQN